MYCNSELIIHTINTHPFTTRQQVVYLYWRIVEWMNSIEQYKRCSENRMVGPDEMMPEIDSIYNLYKSSITYETIRRLYFVIELLYCKELGEYAAVTTTRDAKLFELFYTGITANYKAENQNFQEPVPQIPEDFSLEKMRNKLDDEPGDENEVTELYIDLVNNVFLAKIDDIEKKLTITPNLHIKLNELKLTLGKSTVLRKRVLNKNRLLEHLRFIEEELQRLFRSRITPMDAMIQSAANQLHIQAGIQNTISGNTIYHRLILVCYSYYIKFGTQTGSGFATEVQSIGAKLMPNDYVWGNELIS